MNIYINNGVDIPEDETCYIIAKGGIYLKKKLDLIESLTPVDKISFLEDIPTFAKINIPLISTKMFGNILGFFKEVYRLYKSEAIVLLFYNKNKKSYKVFVPEQEVSSASLSYDSTKTIKDHILIGSIHSHGSMSAFHSGTDVGDEAKFDGIHLTIGKVNETFFDVCGSIAVNGMRVPISPENYITGLESREYTPYFKSMFLPGFEIIEGEKVYKNQVKSSFGYSLNCSNKDYNFNEAWLKNVKEKEYPTYDYSSFGHSSRYIYQGGKLIKIKDDSIDKLQSNLFTEFNYGSNNQKKERKTDFCVCKHCIHRDEKLKLEDCKDVHDKDLENNFDYQSFELMNYNEKWWD
jgi:hypothetical protein